MKREPTVIDFVLVGAFLLVNVLLLLICDKHGLSVPQFVMWLAIIALVTPSVYRIDAFLKGHRDL